MELKAGYKQTEVGVIPEDWSVARISEVAEIKTGNKNTDDKIDDGLYPFFVRSQKVERINSFVCDEEAVLTAGDGVGVGKVFHYVNGKFDFHQRVYKISHFNGVNGKFFFEYFKQNFLNEAIKYTAKSSVDSVRMDMIAGMVMPVPPLPEQYAIATALSDVDTLIGALDALIAKKRNIKQGAMQELLTGKKRLAGFGQNGYKQTDVGVIPEDWEVKTLGSMVKIFGGGTPSTSIAEYWGGQIPWVSAGDVSRANGRYIYETAECISELGLASSPAIVLPKGTTIIIARGATVGRMAQLGREMAFNQTCYGLLPGNSLDKDYLYYSMLFSVESIKPLTYGTIFGTITTNSFQQWLIPLPPLPEQQAIAAALSDMDIEIVGLERKRAKYQAVKQGMMQELLTGKTRLVGAL